MYHEHSLYVSYTTSFNPIPMLIDSDQFTTFNLITYSPCNYACCFCAMHMFSPVFSFTLQKLKQPVKRQGILLKCPLWHHKWLFSCTKRPVISWEITADRNTYSHWKHCSSRSDTNTELSRPNLPTWCSICIDSSILILISLEALTCSGRAFWTSNLTFLICFRLNQPPSLLRYWTQW